MLPNILQYLTLGVCLLGEFFLIGPNLVLRDDIIYWQAGWSCRRLNISALFQTLYRRWRRRE